MTKDPKKVSLLPNKDWFQSRHQFKASNPAVATLKAAFPDAKFKDGGGCWGNWACSLGLDWGILDGRPATCSCTFGDMVMVTGPTRQQVAAALVIAGLPSRDAKRFGFV